MRFHLGLLLLLQCLCSLGSVIPLAEHLGDASIVPRSLFTRGGLVKRWNFVFDYAYEVSQQDRTTMETEFRAEMEQVVLLANNVLDIPSSTVTYRYYFGQDRYWETVHGVFQRIAGIGNDARNFRITFTNQQRQGSTRAVAWIDSSDRNHMFIHVPRYTMWPAHITLRDRGLQGTQIDRYRTRAVTLLHELTHVPGIGGWTSSGGTVYPQRDVRFSERELRYAGRSVYDQELTHYLALTSTTLAMQNADNYAMFALACWINQWNLNRRPTQADFPDDGTTDFRGSRDFNPNPPRPYLRLWWLGKYVGDL